MYDGTVDEINVSLPAAIEFHAVAKAAVSGLAIRLGVDFQKVENLRMATDLACKAISGPGEINLHASWEPGHLAIDLENRSIILSESAARILEQQISDLVGQAVAKHGHVGFALEE